MFVWGNGLGLSILDVPATGSRFNAPDGSLSFYSFLLHVCQQSNSLYFAYSIHEEVGMIYSLAMDFC